MRDEHAGFGPQHLPEGVEVGALGIPAGRLTVLHAAACGRTRGTVLFVPGFTGSKEDFLTFLPRMAAAGYDAWAYSQRGQADSASPSGPAAYTLDAFAGDLIEIAELIGEAAGPLHLVGHSFGGVVARGAVIARPALFDTLTLFASGPRAIPSTPETVGAAEVIRAAGPSGLFRAAHPELTDEPQSDADLEMERLRSHATSKANLLGVIDILASYPDRTADLAATGRPVHIVYGEDDPVWPREWYLPEAAELGARRTVIAGAGHSAQLDRPAELADAMTDFWDHQLAEAK